MLNYPQNSNFSLKYRQITSKLATSTPNLTPNLLQIHVYLLVNSLINRAFGPINKHICMHR